MLLIVCRLVLYVFFKGSFRGLFVRLERVLFAVFCGFLRL